MSLTRAWSRLQSLRDEPARSDVLLTRAALILCVPIMLAYGCAGLVYGELPMLTPFGFVEMPGACAWLTAAMAFAKSGPCNHDGSVSGQQSRTR